MVWKFGIGGSAVTSFGSLSKARFYTVPLHQHREVTFVAKSREREKELRRRRHRRWKRWKKRIKQAILEARLRKLEQQRKQQAAAATAEQTTAETVT